MVFRKSPCVNRKACKKDAEVTLDPTILLGADKWSEIAECDCNEPYVFVYSVMPQISLVNFARKLAKEKNMKVIFYRVR